MRPKIYQSRIVMKSTAPFFPLIKKRERKKEKGLYNSRLIKKSGITIFLIAFYKLSSSAVEVNLSIEILSYYPLDLFS